MRSALAIGLWLTLLASPAAADGLARVAGGVAGPFELSVFVSPSPLRADPADWSVLVKDRRDGSVVLDAQVELELHEQSPSSQHSHPLRAAALPGALLYSTRLAASSPGPRVVIVRVTRAQGVGELRFPVTVGPAPAPLREHWRAFAIPPLALGLFALQQWRVHRSRRR